MRSGNKWIKYDDSHTSEIEDNMVKTNTSYLLIYKLKEEQSSDYFNLLSEIYFNSDEISRAKTSSETNTVISSLSKGKLSSGVQIPAKNLFIGEPVGTCYGNAIILEIYHIESYQFVKVKFKFGYGFIK
jgi:hypothetical protein